MNARGTSYVRTLFARVYTKYQQKKEETLKGKLNFWPSFALIGLQGSNLPNIVPSILILAAFVAIFYFLLIRPQRKRQKEHQELVKKLQRGDKVITAGGIHGKITKLGEDYLMLEVESGVTLKISRGSIAEKEE